MTARIPHNPMMILSAGTKVVLRGGLAARDSAAAQPAGAVGVIIKSPVDQRHSYRVRFPDGSEAPLRRTEFVLLKEVQAEAAGLRAGTAGARGGDTADTAVARGGTADTARTGGDTADTAVTRGDALADFDLYGCVIYRCVVGSRAYGLASEESDTDRRGIYLPPAEMQWSLYGVPEQLENPATEEAYWELQKFLVLALKANPNVLECLYTPVVEHATALAEELRAMRGAFLSKLVYQTYNGYVLSQFKKLDTGRARHGKIKWKHAMHLIRLLLAGITALREGQVPVSVGEHRAQLLAIRDGQMAWDELNRWRLALHHEFDAAYAGTKLPERPDYERANGLLIDARRSAASGLALPRRSGSVR